MTPTLRRSTAAVFLGLCSLAGISRSAAAAPTCTVVADTFVLQTDLHGNFGTRAMLQVDATPMERAFLRIVVSGVGAGEVVTGVALKLRTSTDDKSDSGGRLHEQSSCAWTETGLTWHNQPSYDATVLDSKGPVGKNQLVEFDPSPAVVTGNGSFCFVLDTLSSDGIDYYSREASSARRPTCMVQVGGATTTSITSTTSITTTTSSTTTTATVLSCQSGESNCAGVCADLGSDPANCGACGHRCVQGEACVPTTGGGACECQSPDTLCGNNIPGVGIVCTQIFPCTCSDLQSDSNNCGTCGNACPAGTDCQEGACVKTCGGDRDCPGQYCCSDDDTTGYHSGSEAPCRYARHCADRVPTATDVTYLNIPPQIGSGSCTRSAQCAEGCCCFQSLNLSPPPADPNCAGNDIVYKYCSPVDPISRCLGRCQ